MNEFSKSFIVAAGVVSLLSDTALAADLPTAKSPPVAPVYVQPPFTWAGFYAGVNAGGAWEEGNSNPLSTPFPGAVPVGAFVPLTSDSNGGHYAGTTVTVHPIQHYGITVTGIAGITVTVHPIQLRSADLVRSR